MFAENTNNFIIDGISIPKGNFAFVYEATHDEVLFNCCLEAEKKRFSDVEDSLKHIRNAIEQFGYYTRSLALVNNPKNLKAINETIKTLQKEYVEQDKKNFDPSKTPRSMARKAMRKKEKQLKKNQSDAVDYLINDLASSIKEQIEEITKNNYGASNYTALLDVLYNIASANSAHVGGGKDNKEDLVSAVKILFVAFKTYFDYAGNFDYNLSPINNYYRLPDKILNNSNEEMSIIEKDVYFSSINKEAFYYLIKEKYNNVDDHKSEQRNIDAIDRLWNDSFITPDRILRDSEVIKAYPVDYQVFKLPGKPIALTASEVDRLQEEDKRTIVNDMKKAIQSLHTANPPLPHRGLNPYSFLICETSQGLRAVLVNFETVKDFKTSTFTVQATLVQYYQNQFLTGFMAPELLDGKTGLDYKKADIYSLGRLILYINTGYAWPTEEIKKKLSTDELAEIEKMIDAEPGNRPTIEELIGASTNVSQSSVIEYAGTTNVGRRREQQDGLYIDHDCMSMDNDHLAFGSRGDEDLCVAVFDGFGGMEDGREVTEKAINTLKGLLQNPDITNINEDYSQKIRSIVDALEKEVADYICKYKLLKSGCAFALAVIHDDHIYTANMGDCSIILIENSRFIKMTKAHRYDESILKEGELYQYLGVSSRNMKIDPYYNQEKYSDNSFLLMCSDGLTNYVTENIITSIVNNHDVTLVDKVKNLREKAFTEGGSDNITIALMEKRRGK